MALLQLGAANCRGQVSRDAYARAERLLPWNAKRLVYKVRVTPNWIEKGNRFWYRNDTRNGKEFMLIDPERNTREPAFDQEKLAVALSRSAGKEYAANKLPFDSFEFRDVKRAIRFEVEKVRWRCELANYQCTRGETVASAEGELLSPDGRMAAYVEGDNLYVRRLDTGEKTALTSDGVTYYNYATSPDARTTAIADKLKGQKLPPVAVWSMDSKKLLTHRLDQRQVEDFYLIQSVLPADRARPVLHSYKYPLVGDAHQPLAELLIFDLDQKNAVRIDTAPQLSPYRSPIESHEVWWSDDKERIYFLREGRGQRAMQLYVADAQTGRTRQILEEQSATYVELNLGFLASPNVRNLGRGEELVWFSERDGWAHLYLYDEKTGAVKNQITSGPWVVRDILHVDEQHRQLYFTAGGRERGRDPYYRHLYRINLDGSNLQLLTPEDGDHEIRFSPTGRYFVDTYSRIDLAPVSVLRSADGALIRKLEDADVAPLLETGWKWPERFSTKARDGVTDIYGVIFRPSSFDPARKYAVIDDIYPGPQIIRTPKAFGWPSDVFSAYQEFWFWHPQALAELGFIVVTIDGLGTPFRSKAFHTAYYGKMGDAGGLEDHIAGLQQLAARYPYMDLSRVGVFGHSGGGFATARAMLAYPDFYKVGVSSAGNHDQRGYLALWGEKYEGLPAGENYTEQANQLLASKLEGKLLLAWGDLDDNVHPALTIRLVDALIKANQDFDLLVMPNRHHDFLSDPYFVRRLWDFFVRHLQAAEPPRYKISGPSER
jgi:dipeptidyl aminopeptidase/acylaminoacyl peptidase